MQGARAQERKHYVVCGSVLFVISSLYSSLSIPSRSCAADAQKRLNCEAFMQIQGRGMLDDMHVMNKACLKEILIENDRGMMNDNDWGKPVQNADA